MFSSLNDLEILSRNKILGEGAFSEVIKVRSRKDNKLYALKKVDTRVISKADSANLKGEMALHRALRHPNIVAFYDSVQEGHMVYFLLEYAANGSLFFYIHITEGLPEELAMRFFYQTALAVEYMHERNLVHRDIKPENILLDNKFNVKLCDFGWSCKVGEEDYRTSICGTYEYMSPEIVKYRRHNNKVDVWCLGILLYEMIHGNPPYQADSLKQLKNEFNNRHIQIKPGVSQDVKDLLMLLLTKDDEKRPSMAEVLQHRAITRNKHKFNSPISQENFSVLVKNYLGNTDVNGKRNLPEALIGLVNTDEEEKPISVGQSKEGVYQNVETGIRTNYNQTTTSRVISNNTSRVFSNNNTVRDNGQAYVPQTTQRTVLGPNSYNFKKTNKQPERIEYNLREQVTDSGKKKVIQLVDNTQRSISEYGLSKAQTPTKPTQVNKHVTPSSFSNSKKTISNKKNETVVVRRISKLNVTPVKAQNKPEPARPNSEANNPPPLLYSFTKTDQNTNTTPLPVMRRNNSKRVITLNSKTDINSVKVDNLPVKEKKENENFQEYRMRNHESVMNVSLFRSNKDSKPTTEVKKETDQQETKRPSRVINLETSNFVNTFHKSKSSLIDRSRIYRREDSIKKEQVKENDVKNFSNHLFTRKSRIIKLDDNSSKILENHLEGKSLKSKVTELKVDNKKLYKHLSSANLHKKKIIGGTRRIGRNLSFLGTSHQAKHRDGITNRKKIDLDTDYKKLFKIE